MTAAERKKLERDRRKAGLVRIEVWAPAEIAGSLQMFIIAQIRMWEMTQVQPIPPVGLGKHP